MISMELSRRESIAALLKVVPDIHLAIVFGSLASGTERFESDIDLAVEAGRPLTVHEKVAVIEVVAQEFGRPVDLVDLHTAGEPVLGQILKNGIRILGTSDEHAKLIRRHVFDNTDFTPYRTRILTERRRAWIGK